VSFIGFLLTGVVVVCGLKGVGRVIGWSWSSPLDKVGGVFDIMMDFDLQEE
jgi:hypothetical protein